MSSALEIFTGKIHRLSMLSECPELGQLIESQLAESELREIHILVAELALNGIMFDVTRKGQDREQLTVDMPSYVLRRYLAEYIHKIISADAQTQLKLLSINRLSRLENPRIWVGAMHTQLPMPIKSGDGRFYIPDFD